MRPPVLASILRRSGRRLPAGIRQRVGRVLARGAGEVRTLAAKGTSEPRLSVIVPVYNVQEYLGECLDSLRAQTLRSLQIILVDDGSTDGSAAVYERHAAEDPRIVVHRQANAGLGAARNAGIRLATGRYITFLDSDDTLPEDAYEVMVRSLDRSGSDFAIGAVRRVTLGRHSSAPWIDIVHREDRSGITIDDFPQAVMDVIACNRVVRRSFWESAGLSFPEGVAYEDHVPMMTAFVRAKSFDVLRAVTYYWRIRENKTSIGQQKRDLQNLKDRLLAKEQAAEILLAEASKPVRDAWLQRVLDLDLTGFVNQVEWTDDEYWQTLSHGARTFLGAASPEVLANVRADRKVKAALVAGGRKEELLEFVDRQRHEGAQMRTVVEGGKVKALLPFHDRADVGLKPEYFELSADQAALVTSLRGICAVESDRLRVTGWAYVRYVDQAVHTPELSVSLVDEVSGERLRLTTVVAENSAVTRWAGHRYQSYDRSEFTVTIDGKELVALAEDQDRTGTLRKWHLEVGCVVGGVERHAVVGHRDTRGSAGHLPALTIGGLRLVPMMVAGRGLVLELRRPVAVLTSAAIRDRSVSGRLTLADGVDATRLQATSSADTVATAELVSDGGELRFDLTLPQVDWADTPLDRRFWTVDVRVGQKGRLQRVAWPETHSREWLGDGPDATVAAMRTERGNLSLREVECFALVDHVELGGDEVLVQGRWVGREPAAWQLLLSTHRIRLQPTSLQRDAGRFTARFPLTVDEWGLGATPLPSGNYRLEVTTSPREVQSHGAQEGADDVALPRLDLSVVEQLPVEALTDTLRLQVRRGQGNHAVISVSAPLADDELGARAQELLREEYATRAYEPRPDDVLLQCYRGESATDSQLAIHEELRSRGAGHRLLWGVSDYSVRIPEGGTPLLIGSRRWYEALASAGWLVNNIDFDRFFVKRPHQTFLQTFHGYPFKSMGMTVWSRTGSQRHVDAEVARRRAAWDVILTPAPEMNEFYRRLFRWEGPILDAGYPRDDVLVSLRAEEIRATTRRLLGIRDDQTAVLYAPTWRDDQAISAWSARATNYLDPAAASEALGEGYVLLMRGHNYIARTSDRSRRTARVLDVTDYPEINDLVLASDAAVLDYSSLRFDYALTGKPMVFLVPDLAQYSADGRGFLYDYHATAPGPLVETTDQVVDQVRDLDRVRQEFAEPYEAFNRAYNHMQDGHATERVVDAVFGRPGA